ncbi:AAA family ATPase [Pseudomonas sp. HK3]
MIYEHYFALTQRPFSIAPNPNFLYACGQYKEALAALEYGMLHRGGFVLLTGEVGTGKTTLCKFLLQSIPQDTEVALVLHPQLDRLELLHLICKEFGLNSQGLLKESQLIDLLTEFLLQVYSKGGYSVLIIDEAQHLDESVLELIRLLTNLETHEDKLLQIILLGQPELKERLNKYQLRQLNQRFTARFHLNGLSFLQVRSYLDHRVEVAGGRDSLFSVSSAWLLYRLTNGIPRLINVLADRCLMGCYAEQKKQVTPFMVWRAAKEVLPSRKASKKSRLWVAMVAVVLIVFGLNNVSDDFNKSVVQPALEHNLVSRFTSEFSNQSSQSKNNHAQTNPCKQKNNCWSGRLPSSIVMNASMSGDVFSDGEWEEFTGQPLEGDEIMVALDNIDERYIDALIKQSDQDVLIPWVREVLLSQNQTGDTEDFSQWQVIAPKSTTNNSSLIYDVVLHGMVKAFQRKHGLMVDGVLGPQTLISLSLWDQQSQMAAQ